MGILTNMRSGGHSIERFSLNTGTSFDIVTGSFLPGINGNMILNGGLSMVNSVIGRAQTYKTSIALGYFTKTLRNYKCSEGICYDSEMSIPNKARLINLSGVVSDQDLENRIELYDKSDKSMEQLFEMARAIANEKEKHKSDYIRETPFLGLDGKPIKSWVPTIIAIDSWSAMSSAKEAIMYEQLNIGDSKTNTLAMHEGKMKTDFMKQIPLLCGSKGIYFVLTAHVDDHIKMDPYAAASRDVPTMSTNDRLKNVGSQFKFLSTNMLQTRKASCMLDSNKKCQYPTDYSSDVELQEISSIICRCKNNVSGAQVNHISSQFYGIQEHLEYLSMLKHVKDLVIGTQKQKLPITDHEFTRHNVRSLITTDYEFRRALEILGHFVYIRNSWNLPNVKRIGYVEFAKKFTSSKELASRMLNSTGNWSFLDDKSDREYMSILDVIELINKTV